MDTSRVPSGFQTRNSRRNDRTNCFSKSRKKIFFQIGVMDLFFRSGLKTGEKRPHPFESPKGVLFSPKIIASVGEFRGPILSILPLKQRYLRMTDVIRAGLSN